MQNWVRNFQLMMIDREIRTKIDIEDISAMAYRIVNKETNIFQSRSEITKLSNAFASTIRETNINTFVFYDLIHKLRIWKVG